MKNLFKLSLLLCFSVLFVACSKDPVTPKASMDLTEHHVSTIVDDKVSVLFSGTVEYIGKIKSVTLKIWTDENPSGEEFDTTPLADGSFFILVPNLNPDAEYHYCYYINYGVSPDYVYEPNTIETPSLPEPTVIKPTVVTVDVTSFGVKGEVTDNGGAPIIERGIYCGMEPLPDTSGVYYPVPITEGTDGMGTFLLIVDEPGTHYVRAYAKNSAGLVGYGKDLIMVAEGGTYHHDL